MKFMLVMRATDESYAAMEQIDFDKMIEIMGRYNDELIRAGVLVAAEGLDSAEEGVVVDYDSDPPVVTRPRNCSAASTSSTSRRRRRQSSGRSACRR